MRAPVAQPLRVSLFAVAMRCAQTSGARHVGGVSEATRSMRVWLCLSLAAATTLEVDRLPEAICVGDTVPIRWSSVPPDAFFSSITVRLRRDTRAVATLGEDRTNSRMFTWRVGSGLPFQKGYDIQVIGSQYNGTVTGTSTTFSVQMSARRYYFLFLLLLLLIPLLACWCHRRRQRRRYSAAIPVAQWADGADYTSCPPAMASTPPCVAVCPASRRAEPSGGGGGVAGAAAAGFVGGVLVEGLLSDSGGGGGGGAGGGGGGVFDSGGGGGVFDSGGGVFDSGGGAGGGVFS